MTLTRLSSRFLAVMAVIAGLSLMAPAALADDHGGHGGHGGHEHHEGHGGGFHGHVGFGLGFGYPYYGYPYYRPYYPYYPYYPTYAPYSVYVTPPPVVVDNGSPVLPYGTSGYQPVQPSIDRSNCREYQSTATVGGARQPVYGVACRQPDGNWRIVQ